MFNDLKFLNFVLVRAILIVSILLAYACLATSCSTFTPQRYPLAGYPGWYVQESAIPLKGIPDEPPGACQQPWPKDQKGPPLPPCGMTDATTSCSEKVVRLWWYARPGALDHELTHVRECK